MDKNGQKRANLGKNLAQSLHSMAKVSLTLDTRRKSAVVKLLINVGAKNSLMTTGVSLDESQWMPEHPNGPVVGHPSARSMNALIKSRLAIAQEVLHLMMLNQEEITLEVLKARILARIDPDRAEQMRPRETFIEWLHKYQWQAKGRTRELYLTTEKRLNEFAVYHVAEIDPRDDDAIHRNPTALTRGSQYLQNLALQDVTPQWLTEVTDYFARTMGVNARAIHMRNIRAVIKYAIKNDVEMRDPFLKFSIKTEETRHRALTPEQFRRLFTYPLPPKEKELIEYRDVALLVFYLIGINVADLFDAVELTDGRLEYVRRKTGRQYSIKVEPEALAIIERYKGQSHLLRYADTNASHISLTKKLDKALKHIGPVEYTPTVSRNHWPTKTFHGLFSDISVYWLRHTWATFAAKLGISKDTIARCLGHGKKTVTDIYIDYDAELIDAANRKVIDYVQTLLQ